MMLWDARDGTWVGGLQGRFFTCCIITRLCCFLPESSTGMPLKCGMRAGSLVPTCMLAEQGLEGCEQEYGFNSGSRTRINLEVGNVSFTGAVISWSPSKLCLADFYHVAYSPWKNILGSLRFSFQDKKVRSLLLQRLEPATLYLL